MRKKKNLRSHKSLKEKNNIKRNPKYLTFKRSWTNKPFHYSPYPYKLIISLFRRNLFLTLTNGRGKTKYWTNSGRSGFTGRTKIEYMSVIKTTQDFLQKMSKLGIKNIFLLFKNFTKARKSVVKGIKTYPQKKKLNFMAITFKNKVLFNGCRRKKSRRR